MTHTCGVCLAETAMPIRIDGRASPLRIRGQVVEVVCVLCAAELGLHETRKPNQ